MRESPGLIAGFFLFSNREMLQILGFRTPEKANLPGTLGRHSQPSVRGVQILKSTVSASSCFSEDGIRSGKN